MVLVAEHRHRDIRDHPALGPVGWGVSFAAALRLLRLCHSSATASKLDPPG
jgi:hypothetical protein